MQSETERERKKSQLCYRYRYRVRSGESERETTGEREKGKKSDALVCSFFFLSFHLQLLHALFLPRSFHCLNKYTHNESPIEERRRGFRPKSRLHWAPANDGRLSTEQLLPLALGSSSQRRRTVASYLSPRSYRLSVSLSLSPSRSFHSLLCSLQQQQQQQQRWQSQPLSPYPTAYTQCDQSSLCPFQIDSSL